MQTVAGRCVTGGRLVTTFSFLRGSPKRSHSNYFCAKLVTKIYSLMPGYLLRQVIVDNPFVFEQSIDTRFGKPFVDVLQPLDMVDGLDGYQKPRKFHDREQSPDLTHVARIFSDCEST